MSALALPGITFDPIVAPPADFLPRMDVCGFVGFASSGPINVPVLVEDSIRFRDVFGPDLTVARTVDGVNVRAHLGAAVDAFFANGGVRAWVVRVAETTGEDAAVTNEFIVPGLISPGTADGQVTEWRLGRVKARSAGAWSDELRVAALLAVDGGVATTITSNELTVPGGTTASEHDVLRIRLSPSRSIFTAVSSVSPLIDDSATTADAMTIGFSTGESGSWLVDTALDFDALAAIDFADEGRAVVRLNTGDPIDIGAARLEVLPAVDVGAPHISLVVPTDTEIGDGDVVAIAGTDDGVALTLLWIGDQSFPTSAPADGQDRYELRRSMTIAPLAADWDSTETIADPLIFERLTVNLQVHSGDHLIASLPGISTHADHARSMTSLPPDEELYSRLAHIPRATTGRASLAEFRNRPLRDLEATVTEPRFPLAAGTASTLLPLALATTQDQTVIGPPPAAAAQLDAPIRNGLARFGAGLFVDPALAAVGPDQIRETAFAVAYVNSNPRPLQGMHALLPLDEVTLVAVPDAGHSGWDRIEVPTPPPLQAPVLQNPVSGEDPAPGSISWSAVSGAESYELLVSPAPEQVNAQRYVTAELTQVLQDLPDCPEARFFRVRARRGIEAGPWSNMTAAFVPVDNFGPCDPPTVPVDLQDAEAAAAADPAAVAWRSRPAIDADPWNDLRAIHAATLRWSAARGDVFALLDLPQSFTAHEAAAYSESLRGTVSEFGTNGMEQTSAFLADGIPRLTSGEASLLQLAAFYHPWIVSGFADAAGGVREQPPAGAMAGIYARRTRDRGAWVAPANESLREVTGLSPNFTDADHLRLLESSVNPIGRDPRGFRPLTARTAGTALGTRHVNVRRLLQLLRRLAAREAMTDVFEPNNAEFRELVRMRFETLLSAMHSRGAFAGATTSEAFEVSTGDAVNTAGLVDRGRFVVEIRVAPSLPLEFITVRLVLSKSAETLVEEALQ